jgi:hypothetical protein
VKRSRFPYVSVLLCVGALAAVGLWSYIAYDSKINTSTVNSAPTPYPTEVTITPTPTPTRKPRPTPSPTDEPVRPATVITPVPEFLELGAEQHQPFSFSTLPNGGQVVGDFAAQGGLANDLRVIVMADSEYASFKSGYPFKQYFDSGKKQGSGRVDAKLPPGNFQIVILNPSPWTSRRIRTSIRVELN